MDYALLFGKQSPSPTERAGEETDHRKLDPGSVWWRSNACGDVPGEYILLSNRLVSNVESTSLKHYPLSEYW